MKNINAFIDHTLLSATATESDIKRLCEEAIEAKFYAVCVNGSRVNFAKKLLQESEVKLASVIGFPLGAMSVKAKVFEAKQSVLDGADEIDMVLNIGWLKEGRIDEVREEILNVKEEIGDAQLKVILETCYLSRDEIIAACKASIAAGADFIKTSTGFGNGGATLEVVKLMKEIGGDQIRIKASGGIRSRQVALEYINLGVDRIGTSSGLLIIKE